MTTIVASNGLTVAVAVSMLPTEPVPVFELVAKVGGTTLKRRHTIGAVSGQIAAYTQASLQAEIDALKTAIANDAAAIEAVRQLGANVT